MDSVPLFRICGAEKKLEFHSLRDGRPMDPAEFFCLWLVNWWEVKKVEMGKDNFLSPFSVGLLWNEMEY